MGSENGIKLTTAKTPECPNFHPRGSKSRSIRSLVSLGTHQFPSFEHFGGHTFLATSGGTLWGHTLLIAWVF